MEAQRDTEQTLMRTFKLKESGMRKSQNSSLMSRVQRRMTGAGGYSGSNFASAVGTVLILFYILYVYISRLAVLWDDSVQGFLSFGVSASSTCSFSHCQRNF
jgi:hypothetical protein